MLKQMYNVHSKIVILPLLCNKQVINCRVDALYQLTVLQDNG